MSKIELVCFDDAGFDRPSNETPSKTKNANITLQQTKATFSVPKVTITRSSFILEALATTELLNKTKIRYEGVLKNEETIVYNEIKILI